MATLDKQNSFSEDQAVTASAASTNVVDTGASNPIAAANIPGATKGSKAFVDVQVTGNFAGGTSIAAKLQSSVDAAFTSPVDHQSSPAIALASLVAGKKFDLGLVPLNTNRYLRVYYTVVGTMTSGTISAYLKTDRT